MNNARQAQDLPLQDIYIFLHIFIIHHNFLRFFQIMHTFHPKNVSFITTEGVRFLNTPMSNLRLW